MREQILFTPVPSKGKSDLSVRRRDKKSRKGAVSRTQDASCRPAPNGSAEDVLTVNIDKEARKVYKNRKLDGVGKASSSDLFYLPPNSDLNDDNNNTCNQSALTFSTTNSMDIQPYLQVAIYFSSATYNNNNV